MDFDDGARPAGHRLTIPVLLAATTLTLTGCVASSDGSMIAGPGFAPGASIPSAESTSGQPNLLQLASVDTTATTTPRSALQPGAVIPAGTSSANENEAGTPALPGAAIAQTDASSIDALHRGITQTGAIKPMKNLYAVPVPQSAPWNQTTAPEVAAAAGQPASVTVPIPLPSPNRSAKIVVARADNKTSIEDDAARSRKTGVAKVAPTALAITEEPEKPSIFARLFNSSPTPPKTVGRGLGKGLSRTSQKTITPPRSIEVASVSTGNSLPGVNLGSLFGFEGDEDGDTHGVEVASAAGLARLAPNGLHTQTDRVDISCLKPGLVRVLRIAERHFGKSVVVTSGYRNPKHNRKVGGARNSRHTTCEAADIQIAGVSKWELAKYLRSMPNRGGVGTYCHTKSVHVDIGTKRDWNWRCRRKK